LKIAIGSDHAAFKLKQMIMQHLKDLGHHYEDLGAFTDAEPANDYHLIGARVAHAVVEGKADLGIIMCGTGIGMSIAANKVPGASAALCDNLFNARKSREHNNANVLVLGARVVGDELAKEIVTTWLDTDYTYGRHETRNVNLRAIERRYQPKD
jgi:ribose 5-phosphate isomerase B